MRRRRKEQQQQPPAMTTTGRKPPQDEETTKAGRKIRSSTPDKVEIMIALRFQSEPKKIDQQRNGERRKQQRQTTQEQKAATAEPNAEAERTAEQDHPLPTVKVFLQRE